MIRKRDFDFIESAINIAEDNKNESGYTMVAILVKNKNLLSLGVNSYKKTHPRQPQTRTYTLTTHAEVKALSRYIVKGRQITNDMTLYIAGITRAKITNHCCSSHPCESCMSFINSIGLKRIVYATNDGNGFRVLEKVIENNEVGTVHRLSII